MRRFFIILFSILLCLLLISCSKPTEEYTDNNSYTEDFTQSQKYYSFEKDSSATIVNQGEIDFQELNSSLESIEKKSRKNIRGIILERSENYGVLGSKFIDNNIIVAIYARQAEDSVLLINYDFSTSAYEIIYAGQIPNVINRDIFFKRIDKGFTAQLPGNVVMFDEDYNIIKEHNLGDDIAEYDISFDGTMIVYSKDNNLYINNIDFTEEKLLLESTEGERLANPKWSHDNKKITYIIFGTHSSKLGIININSNNNELINDDALFAHWFKDNQTIIYGHDEYDETMAVVYNTIDQEKNFVHQDVRSYGFVPCPCGSKIAYAEDYGSTDTKLVIYNNELKKSFPVEYDFGRISLINWGLCCNKIMIMSHDEDYNSIFTILDYGF